MISTLLALLHEQQQCYDMLQVWEAGCTLMIVCRRRSARFQTVMTPAPPPAAIRGISPPAPLNQIELKTLDTHLLPRCLMLQFLCTVITSPFTVRPLPCCRFVAVPCNMTASLGSYSMCPGQGTTDCNDHEKGPIYCKLDAFGQHA